MQPPAVVVDTAILDKVILDVATSTIRPNSECKAQLIINIQRLRKNRYGEPYICLLYTSAGKYIECIIYVNHVM